MFVHEDVSTNRPPTEITAAWLNAVQEEIIAVIAAQNIALKKASSAQLLGALDQRYAAKSHTHDAATQAAAGLMSGADKAKLDGIATQANKYELPAATATVLGGIKLGSATVQTVAASAVTTTASRSYAVQVNAAGQAVVNVPWENTTYSAATQAAAGMMSAADKTKLDGIAAQANKYELPAATAAALGGIKLGHATVQTVAAAAPTATASRTYPVQVNSAGQAVVNVPWTNTTYSAATTGAAGLMSAADKTKIDAITQSLGASGYQKLPGGLIFQWGKVAQLNAEQFESVTFPVAFPSDVFGVTATVHYATPRNENGCIAQIRNLTKTGCIVDNQYAASLVQTVDIYWSAWGK